MKTKIYLVLALAILSFWSCSNNKVIELPELNSSNIHEILDVSPAYIFYNPSEKDSVELNRKNLISTTNWLVNVDKRLTMKQAIPKIQFIQNKKRNAEMHKNENAKNYFTCHDLSINNLGFIEFTDVYYYFSAEQKPTIDQNVIEVFIDSKAITITEKTLQKEELIPGLKSILTSNASSSFEMQWDSGLSFQEYISYKELLINSDLPKEVISKKEVVFN
ncbi:MAG: hypothetical protein BM564_04935 [Bacteroidetes bacterium MedPE-SWsnd-G2]|nr:MAG: hypothetical protein BM564_04935 [Bacteroidetes bacterium MedPE-SWsnd-G2]